jgi:hypothetical protein
MYFPWTSLNQQYLEKEYEAGTKFATFNKVLLSFIPRDTLSVT